MNKQAQTKHQMQANLFAAIAHPLRVAIVDLLKDEDVCVCEIAERIGAERSNTSRHLAILLRSGVVKTRKEGLQVFYSLQMRCVNTFLRCACEGIEENLRAQTEALTQ